MPHICVEPLSLRPTLSVFTASSFWCLFWHLSPDSCQLFVRILWSRSDMARVFSSVKCIPWDCNVLVFIECHLHCLSHWCVPVQQRHVPSLLMQKKGCSTQISFPPEATVLRTMETSFLGTCLHKGWSLVERAFLCTPESELWRVMFSHQVNEALRRIYQKAGDFLLKISWIFSKRDLFKSSCCNFRHWENSVSQKNWGN